MILELQLLFMLDFLRIVFSNHIQLFLLLFSDDGEGEEQREELRRDDPEVQNQIKGISYFIL